MPTLYLIVFDAMFLPNKMAHWTLFLPYKDGCNDGRLFSVKKQGPVSRQTQFVPRDFNIRAEKNITVIQLPLIVHETTVWNACGDVTEKRLFDLWSNNCQKWVCEVVKQIEETLNLKTHINVPKIASNYGYGLFNGQQR